MFRLTWQIIQKSLLRHYAPRNDSLSEHIFNSHYPASPPKAKATGTLAYRAIATLLSF
jgi:hypothetical protein